LKKTYRWLLEIQVQLKNEKKQKFYQDILDKMTIGQVKVITGLPSNQLVDFLDNSDEDVVNYKDGDVLSRQLKDLNLEKCVGKTIFLPLAEITQLPINLDSKIMIISAEIDDASAFIAKNTVKGGGHAVYDLSANRALENILYSVESWLDQQPDLDIERHSVNN
jgi:hypothetical protein